MKFKYQPKFKSKPVRVELDQFLFKHPQFKQKSLNEQLAAAVSAGYITYEQMVRYRDHMLREQVENAKAELADSAQATAKAASV